MKSLNPVAAALFRFGWVFLTALLPLGHAAEVTIAWNPNPAAENVTSYRVWRGIDVIATTTDTTAVLDLPAVPQTLTVTARTDDAESDHSAPMTIIPVTVQESDDLKTWRNLKTIFREFKQAAFFRIQFHTP